MNKDNELSNKIIKLRLESLEKESNIYLEAIYTKIKFYERQIIDINKIKYLKIQKKKIKEQKEKIEEYNNKIIELYKKLEKEIDFMTELNNQM